jgi:hypothetical protein
MKKTLKEQVDRSQELIQYDNSGAQEKEAESIPSSQTGPTAEVRLSTCNGSSASGYVCATIVPQFVSNLAAYQIVQNGGGTQPQIGDVVKTQWNPNRTYFVSHMKNIGCGPAIWQLGPPTAGYCCERACDTSLNTSAMGSTFWSQTNGDTCGPAPNYGCGGTSTNYECTTNGCVVDPNGQYTGPTAQSDCQANCGNFGAGWFCLPPGGGGQGSCQYTPSMTIGSNGPFPTEQDCETAAYCAGSTSVDCTQYGVDYDPVTLDNTSGGFFHPQGLTLATNGNCQGIQNKIQQVNNISNQDKKDCRLDYLNLLLALCQGNSSGTNLNPNWINMMTTRYNGTGAPSGCWGLSGNNNQSICGRKAHFCPGNTPMKQAKCQWLTNFTSTNNCNC